MIGTPLQYFPVSSNSFEFKTGLRAIAPDHNPGNKIFQIDTQWQQYRQAKMAARAERLEKYVCSHQLSPATESCATLCILNQLQREHPEQFELSYSRNNVRLHCRLSGEQLDFDQSLQLINNNKYQSALDALCCQVQEDIAIVERCKQKDFISYLHLCLPNHWAAEDKIGQSFIEAHLPVPEMDKINQQAPRILDTLTHKGPFERFTWGIATDKRLNHHPKAPDGFAQTEWQGRKFDADKLALYLRIERQTTIGLPEVEAFMFTIRTYHRKVRNLASDELTILKHAILTMPDTVKAYKGLHRQSEEICEYLDRLLA
ncbi:MAG: DUF3445 domain-containing protein [Gammaproteobacteria bacterium]|jgi:hypothetical protein